MIPLATPNLLGREDEFLADCIRSTFVSSVGPFVDEFEAGIARLSGTGKAAVLCTGTVALQMALEGLGIGQGDLVMVPTLTFIATPNSISHSGARPWLVDVSADSWMRRHPSPMRPNSPATDHRSKNVIRTEGLMWHRSSTSTQNGSRRQILGSLRTRNRDEPNSSAIVATASPTNSSALGEPNQLGLNSSQSCHADAADSRIRSLSR